MCILSGRLNSTTNGPVMSPNEIFPETRSACIARILPKPPRAARTLPRISSTFCPQAEACNSTASGRTRSAHTTRFSLINFMVAADTHAEQCIPRLTTSTDSSARCADLSSPDCGNPEGEEHGDKGFISQRNYDCYPPLATEADS